MSLRDCVGWTKARLRRARHLSVLSSLMVGTLRFARPYECHAASDRQLSPCNPPIGLHIALAGRVDHASRQRRRWRIAVPAAGAPLGVEIIAQWLLVEARLQLAWLVNIR